MAMLLRKEEIRALLEQARSIAVVGLSDRPERDSYRVARYMQEHGYRIIPVNPHLSSVLGLACLPDLDSIAEPVDIVDIFRRPEYLPEIVEAAIRLKAGAVWTQIGIVHEEAAQRAIGAGLNVVMDRCLMVEHRMLGISSR
ncbi:MAG: CoA-binding protein [Bacteroidota bacterium]